MLSRLSFPVRFSCVSALLAPVVLFGAAAEADRTGLLVLTADTAVLSGLEHRSAALAAEACTVWRHGRIDGSRGALTLGEARGFALLDCEAPQLETADSRARLRAALGVAGDAWMVEGAFRERQAAFATMPDTPDRHYVIKLGAFNNRAPDARQSARAAFMQEAGTRPHAFSTEAVIDVGTTVGLATPDTVEVFYYADAAEGAAFVRENADILTASDAFNAAHFDRYVYFAGVAYAADAPQNQARLYRAGERLSFVMTDAPRLSGVPESGISYAVTQSIVGAFPAGALAVVRDGAPDMFDTGGEGAALRLYSRELEEDLALSLDPDKFYTLAVAWLNPEHPGDYAEYFARIDADVTASGGRFLYKMFDPDLSGADLERGAPDQVTLVEWDSRDSLRNLQSRETYRAASSLLRTGVSYFEFYALALRE